MLAVAFMVSAMTVNVANAAVSLKSSGDQWGPAVQDLMNAKENGNWNEARFISTFNNRFNGTAEEAKALLNSLKAGNVPSSASEFNNSISTPNPGNGNGNGNSGNNGGSTCTGNPHDCNSGSGITQEQLEASQKAQDDKQLVKDNSQDKAIESKADQSALNDVSVKTDHAFDIAVEGRATANNALSTVYGLIPQVLDNGKKITDVDTKVDANKADQANRDKGQDDHINAVQGAAQTANERATDLEKRADVSEGAIRETNEQLAVTDGRSIDNSKRLDGVEAKNDEQDNAIAGKADQSALDKEVTDRQKGDDKLQANIDKNKSEQAKTDAKQNAAIDGKVDKSTYAVDKAKQAVHDTVQDAAIVGLAVTKADKADLNKEVSDRKKADDKLQANINTEAKTRAEADTALKNNIDANKEAQAKTDARQDQDLSTETDNRVAGDKALKANIDQNKAEQAVTDSNQDKVIATKASKKELADEAVARQDADKNLQANIDTESSTRSNADKSLKANIDKNKADQVVTDSNQDKVIATKASKKELANETASRQSADAKLSSRIDSNDATLVQHDQRITSNTQRIGSVEGRVSNLEQSTNKRFSDVDKRIGENRKVASAGIAGAGAMANIPQVTQNGNVSVGAGIGGYDGEQAVAVGFSARVSESVTTKVSVSTNTQSEVLWGAGVGVEW